VLAHLAGVGNAAARQLEAAVAGEVVEFYDGGMPGRAAAIEAGAGASAAEHRTRVRAAVARLEAAVHALQPPDLDRTTGYRGRAAGQVVVAWWREAEIHLTDLAVGPDHSTWDGRLREHLMAYLEPRVPDGVRVDLVPTDADEGRSLGSGEPFVVTGSANDLVAWLAGREPLGTVVAERDGAPAPLPTLDPWP
jgi:maleylpyruvate isomerase